MWFDYARVSLRADQQPGTKYAAVNPAPLNSGGVPVLDELMNLFCNSLSPAPALKKGRTAAAPGRAITPHSLRPKGDGGVGGDWEDDVPGRPAIPKAYH